MATRPPYLHNHLQEDNITSSKQQACKANHQKRYIAKLLEKRKKKKKKKTMYSVLKRHRTLSRHHHLQDNKVSHTECLENNPDCSRPLHPTQVTECGPISHLAQSQAGSRGFSLHTNVSFGWSI